ncbi:MAG TPA: putative manganese-dependent inorganic diphosphatase [Lachnospiraceae bacterium]|jgi:manganese-dependent inorganic pyrophosphatase|nr:putative manganese-dependent inorganic pyrophosphatase [Butyrivibrio sp. CAG:318]HJI32754.1 putative manganese-dependent inorganic diphosphatase [Lachnospiraceae bacterium]
MSEVYVVGHRNPDTDSICSAIAYANFKNITTNTEDYVPYRAGQLNEETQFVLESCGVKAPPLLQDLRAQVSDLQIRKTESIKSSVSMKKVWKMMKEIGVVTLPVVKNRKLEGIITITDIATSYMDIYDNDLLELSETTYKQIAETLDGRIVCGSDKRPTVSGKVCTAVATPEVMEESIAPGDIVIVGNRYEAQLCAIEMGAGCLVICDKAPVSITITKHAQDNGCTIISTPHDAFMVSRLIFQSVPVGHMMRREGLITFRLDDYIDDIRKVMTEKRHRDFPILDKHGHYVGMISRRNLLGAPKKKVIMVDHNEAKQAVAGIEAAEVVEIIDHHRLGCIETISPVLFRNQPVGCTATIIYSLYRDAGVEVTPVMAKLMCSAIISDTLLFRSPTCTDEDRIAGHELSQIAGLDLKAYAHEMFFAGSNLSEKTAKELFTSDYKKFSLGDVTFGIGQVSSMDSDELAQVRNKIYSYMKDQYKSLGVDMLFFMLTDMMQPKTELLYYGDGAGTLAENALGAPAVDGSVMLPGVVSRKKQIVPQIMMEITQ